MNQVWAARSQAPTRDEMLARTRLLADEMDGIEEENMAMQFELEELYRRADRSPPLADRDELLSRAKVLADEMDANDTEKRDMQDEIDALYKQLDSADDSVLEAPAA